MTKRTLLQRLKAITKPYKEKKRLFESRCGMLKQQFGLNSEQEREVDFGIIIPADRSLQKYCDILNADPELNEIQNQIRNVILEGCVDIFKDLRFREKLFPGYDIDAFIRSPEDNTQEIKELMQGLGGYKHIHSIGEKIALEIPAKEFLPKDRQLKRAINYWLKSVKEFSMWE